MKHLSKVLNVTLISYIGEMVTSQNMKILLIDKVRIEVHVILLAASNNISLSYRKNEKRYFALLAPTTVSIPIYEMKMIYRKLITVLQIPGSDPPPRCLLF